MDDSDESSGATPDLVSLGVEHPIWERFFQIAPLVIVGTKESDGGYDLAPKTLAMPMGWDNYFGFVCTPAHGTYTNAVREGAFTVNFPKPSQVLLASLAAAPRCEDGSQPSLDVLATFPARVVDGMLLEDADRDDEQTIFEAPLLAYVSPGRYAEVSHTFAFPFHKGWSR